MADTTAERLASRIVNSLHNRGFQAYLVGGCVRDLLLDRVPKDYDVATDARPGQILDLFPEARQVGAHFGVLLVAEGDVHVEVATFRSDLSYRDGRRPDSVEFETGPRKDVLRRDFTVNALLMDPRNGEVLDFAGGLDDIRARLIRAIGDPEKRFREDHLRMLRAVRFAAGLGFRIDPGTMEAIRSLHSLVGQVSAERVRDELVKILTGEDARRGFELLDEAGLLAEVLPEVAAMKGVEQPPEFHPEGDVWIHTLLMLGELRQPTPTLALGVLLHDVGKPPTFRCEDRIRFNGHAELGARMAAGILARLRFSGDEIRRVEALVSNHLRFKDVERMRESTLKRFLREPFFDEHLELHRLDCLASHRNLDHHEFLTAKLRELPLEEIKPHKLFTGNDLIAAGYCPGRAFKEILEAVEDAQLEGKLRSREEALAFVLSVFDRPSGRPKSACT